MRERGPDRAGRSAARTEDRDRSCVPPRARPPLAHASMCCRAAGRRFAWQIRQEGASNRKTASPGTASHGLQGKPLPAKWFVDLHHPVEVQRRYALRRVLKRRPRDRQQPALRPERQLGMGWFDHPPPHFPIQGLSFRDKKSLATAFAHSLQPGAFMPQSALYDNDRYPHLGQLYHYCRVRHRARTDGTPMAH